MVTKKPWCQPTALAPTIGTCANTTWQCQRQQCCVMLALVLSLCMVGGLASRGARTELGDTLWCLKARGDNALYVLFGSWTPQGMDPSGIVPAIAHVHTPCKRLHCPPPPHPHPSMAFPHVH